MGNWAQGKQRGEGCDVLEQSQAAAARGVDGQVTGRWRQPSGAEQPGKSGPAGGALLRNQEFDETEVEGKDSRLDWDTIGNRPYFSLFTSCNSG